MNSSKTLLILDLDETLIFSDRKPNNPFMQVGPFHVHKRPHLDHFINTVQKWFTLAVWTAGSEDYATPIVEKIFENTPLEFVYTEDRCSFKKIQDSSPYSTSRDVAIKNLKKVRWPIERILVVEDTPENIPTFGNVIRVKPFCGFKEDEELLRLLPFLERIKDEKNVRTVEKRNWRSTKVAVF